VSEKQIEKIRFIDEEPVAAELPLNEKPGQSGSSVVQHKKISIRNRISHLAAIFIGTIVAAFALEICLLPNSLIDGGITGVSIMLRYVTHLPLGLFLVVLNAPFIIIGYKQIGMSFSLYSLFGIISLAFWTHFLSQYDTFFHDPLLAAIFGGIFLGIGIGIVMRFGGSLDGTEIISILLSRVISFSVGEIVLIINVFIYAAAGLLLGWEQAMYSLLTYVAASKAIDVTVNGINESKQVFIITDHEEEISAALLARLGRGITVMQGEGAYSRTDKHVLYVVITRLEIAKLKAVVEDIDPAAFITISDVYEVRGGAFRKKSIH